MKLCPTCKTQKPTDEFSRNKTARDGLANQCKSCMKVYRDRHYQENKVRLRADIVARKQTIKDRYWKYKNSVKCTDCPVSDPRVLEFDHIGSDKSGGVAQLVLRGCSWDTIKAEIDKCEPVCANCHRIRTHERGGWVRNMNIEAECMVE